MKNKITVEDKKQFLYWFISHHTLANRQVIWILNHIYQHHVMLEKVHFVEHAEKAPRGMIVNTIDIEADQDFSYIRRDKVYHSTEVALHEVKFDWSTPLYIEVNFVDQMRSPEYLRVLEDNPFYDWNQTVPEELQDFITLQLKKTRLAHQLKRIDAEIDRALETNDKAGFMKLTTEKQALEELSNLEADYDSLGSEDHYGN